MARLRGRYTRATPPARPPVINPTRLTRFHLPGFSLPLNYTPERYFINHALFPNALDYNDIASGLINRLDTSRELLMMQVMNYITEKYEWHQKDITNSGKDVTPEMMDWIIQELQWKADTFSKIGQTVVFDAGVVKSDVAIPGNLQRALKEEVKLLENALEGQKDYHPGSDNKVVDLVDPSLFPVVYGRSRVLQGQTIGLEDDCFASIGQGKTLSVPPEESAITLNYDSPYLRDHAYKPYSRKFQWMPCDIDFVNGSQCRIVSYINNLHPQKYCRLYESIEKILTRTIPLWNTTLTNVRAKYQRIYYDEVEFLDHPEPEPQPANEEEEMSREFWDRHREWEHSRPIQLPDPGEFEPPKVRPNDQVNLDKRFADRGLQVIVKLANIELSGEKPRYEGGSWRVEGQLNDHICATAIYYYDCENITESTLSFRQRADTDSTDISYPQGQHEFMYQVFGFDRDQGVTRATQDLGSVSTCVGRLVTFPNTLQHRVSPFSLVDPSKPGHRKILAFFLVDPNIRIMSSANVPPQREDWWEERKKVLNSLVGQKLPAELRDMVIGELDAVPITMSEAKDYRLELMEERKVVAVEQSEAFQVGNFLLRSQ